MSEYFLEPRFSGGEVKVKLDLSSCAAKTDLKNATRVHTSKFAKKIGLANSKSDIDKLVIDKLKRVPSYWNNLKRKVNILDIEELAPVLLI